MRTGCGTEVGVQGGIGGRTSTNARGQGVGTGGSSEVVAIAAGSSERSSSRSEGAGAGGSSHRAGAHAVVGTAVHGGGIARIGDNSGASTTSAASKAADVLGKVVVTTDFIATFPISSSERNNAAAAASTATAHTTSSVAAHVAVMTTTTTTTTTVMGRRAHHGGRAVAVAEVHVPLRARTNCGERAAEASSSSLEIREATRGAGPVSRSRTVLAGREGCENFGGAVQNSARGRGHFDGLLVQGTTIHAETLGSLEAGGVSHHKNKIEF